MATLPSSGVAAAGRTVELRWKEFFRDPVLWVDNRTTKPTSGSPDFTHTITCEHLWVHGWGNPSWILDELHRRTIIQSKQEKIKGWSDRRVGNDNHEEIIAFISSLKACTRTKDIHKGSKLHVDILKGHFLEQSPHLASVLINMYAKCGMLSKALEVLEALPNHDTVSWNALITGLLLQEKYGDAISCFELMQIEGLSPDAVTFISILKACGGKLDMVMGKQIHDEVVSRGLLEKDVVLGTSLVDMYAKCGLLEKAQSVLEGLPIRNEISWNVLISGYAQQGQGHSVLRCLEQMQSEGIIPNEVSFLCTLKACASMKAIDKGKQIHDEIVHRNLLEKHIVLGTALVDMYAKCGSLLKAREVLEYLPVRNTVSWNVLIAGYIDQGQHHEALQCFEQMQSEGLSPNSVTFICILKACGTISDIDKGWIIYEEIMKKGFLVKDIVLGTALVDMFAKCGAVEKAQEVLKGLPARNVVAWSALIMGYVQQGKAHEALKCYKEMHDEGFFPDVVAFVCVLKACGITQTIGTGNQVHCEIVRRGFLGEDAMLCTALVDMYAKCDLLVTAQEVLMELPMRNVSSWNALIAGYVQQGQGQEALTCFEQMQNEGLSPDEVTLICLLSACGKTKDIDKGKQIHDEIVARGLLQKDIVLGNALVDMYAKCSMLEKAQQVLEELPVQNVVSWSALISGYAQEGVLHKALSCFNQMRYAGLSPDVITLICILKACGSSRDVEKGQQIHREIIAMGSWENSMPLGTALVDMYAKCGLLTKAKEVLEDLPVRDVVAWNALIAGLVEQEQGHAALDCVERMQDEGLVPDSVTLICTLKACSSAQAIDKGKLIHEQIRSRGLMHCNVVLGTALVDMYAKCGVITKAQEVIEELLVRDVVSWNALIGGYTELEQGHEGLKCLEQMQKEGLTPDGVTFTLSLRACSCIDAIGKGKQIHGQIVTTGLLEKDAALGTTLVDMYAKSGMLVEAQKVLEELPIRGVITWNALIAGHVELELGHTALQCVEQMQIEGLSPNAVTFLCMLKACGSMGAVDRGKQIHEVIGSNGFLDEHVELGNALVDMYAKCGTTVKAQEVLDQLSVRVVVSWNALIAGYAQQGQVREALSCFELMQIEGLHPDEVTVLCAMNACSHSGLSYEAQMLFGSMSGKYDITPRVEHHTCMVMVLGSAGQFDKALSVIEMMPCTSHPAVWLALLAACKKWEKVRLAMAAFDQAVQEAADENAAAYVLMCSIFSAAGMYIDAGSLEECRLKHASCKGGGGRDG